MGPSQATLSEADAYCSHAVTAEGAREGKAFASALTAVLGLAAVRLAVGRMLPMDHEISYLVDGVHVLEGLVLLLASYTAAAKGLTRLSYILRAVGLGYLFAIGVGPMNKQIYWLSRNLPLADDAMATVDRLLGFNWRDYVSLFKNPAVMAFLSAAYYSIDKQPFAIGLFLAYEKMPGRLYTFVVAQSLCIGLVTLVTVFLPACGAYHFFGITPTSMPFITGGDMDLVASPLKAIRAGFLEIGHTQPLVQFPSYHAAACILYVWATWGTKASFPVAALNVVMFASAPVFGCHYLCDMIVGACLAMVSVVIVERLVMGVTTARHCPPERETADIFLSKSSAIL